MQRFGSLREVDNVAQRLASTRGSPHRWGSSLVLMVVQYSTIAECIADSGQTLVMQLFAELISFSAGVVGRIGKT
jgi:hypothetical protein